MQRWRVSYITNEDDSCNVWVYGNTKEEAEENFKREYWDWERISQIIPLDD